MKEPDEAYEEKEYAQEKGKIKSKAPVFIKFFLYSDIFVFISNNCHTCCRLFKRMFIVPLLFGED